MTKELFEKAQFGDRFVTRGGQEALFLRLTENSECQFADFYVKDWGLIRVNRENGKCLNGPDIENDIVGMMPSLPSNLDEAAKKAYKEYDVKTAVKPKEHPVGFLFFDGFKAGAEWTTRQGVSLAHLIAWYIQSVDAHEPVWTKEHLEELVKDYILIPKN